MSRRPLRLLLALGVLIASAAAQAAPKTVCTITINSPDEKETFQRHLPPGDYRFVELVRKGRPDWFEAARASGIACDALIISGHFDDGTEFYTDRFDNHEFLTVHDLQRASCSATGQRSGLFSQLKEVYLFGCNTLKTEPRHVAGAEVLRSLVAAGKAPAEAEREAARLSARYGQSNRDRLRQIFQGVPVLYGFSSKAPLGHVAGPMLERYFQTAPANEVASGRPSPTLLKLFGPASMIAAEGLTAADPQASFRDDVCAFADERPTDVQKVAFLHEALRRDPTEARMFLDHLERYAAQLTPARRALPDVAAGLAAIERDAAVRDRYLAFARQADEASVQWRMVLLARSLGWLDAAQERDEFVRLVSTRMARDTLGRHEVDLVCDAHKERDPGVLQRVLAGGAVRPNRVAHAAALACLGSDEAHERTVLALTSPRDEDIEIAQAYLRHRPLADARQLRSLATAIGHLSTPEAQVRALEALARQRLADAPSLQEIVGLFPRARSLAVQRAIAGLLIRADHRLLARDEVLRTLRVHRRKSPDGSDVIDTLIRVLQSA